MVFRPQWTDAMASAALAWFPPSIDDELRHLLGPLQLDAQELFQPTCLVSGDPNPRNWGVRHDGSLVLFDWERFGRATPMIDVAISVPSLAGPEVFVAAARSYLNTPDRLAAEAFARQCAIAKTWTVVELLSELHGHESPPGDLMMYLIERFLPWLREIDRFLR
jgi:thiamine kinase-like enzyme